MVRRVAHTVRQVVIAAPRAIIALHRLVLLVGVVAQH